MEDQGTPRPTKDVLDKILDMQFNRLPASTVLALRKRVQDLFDATGGQILLSTACSGSDVVVTVINAIAKKLEGMFGITFTVVHDFSCESVEMKRNWIKTHFAPRHIFPDIERLAAVCEVALVP